MRINEISGSERLKYVIGNQYKDCLDLPVNDHMILFVERYVNGATGDMVNLLRACFACKELEAFTFVWTASTYADVELLFDEELIRSGRVRVVTSESYEFLEALALAKYVFTELTLPQWYVKRSSQVVTFFAGQDAMVDRELFTRNMVQTVSATMNKVDYLVAPDDVVSYLSANRSPSCETHLKCINSSLPRFDAFLPASAQSKTLQPKALIAYSQALFDAEWGDSEDGFNDWTRRTAAHLGLNRNELIIVVPSLAMDAFNEESTYAYATVVRSLFGPLPFAGGDTVVLTDNGETLFDMQERGIRCVVLENNDGDVAAMGCNGYERYEREDEALDAVRHMLFDGSVRSAAHNESRRNSETVRDAVLFGDDRCVSTVPVSGNRDLLITRWADSDAYHDLIAGKFNGAAGTVLLMRNTGYWILDSDAQAMRDMCVTFRTGYHLGTDEERALISNGSIDELAERIKDNPHNFVRLEWRRVLGDVRFDTIYAPNNLDGFWGLMMKFVPADRVVLYGDISEVVSAAEQQ